ncbi:MAG: hypothetical protein IRY97_12855, partial [Thermomicrobiaceae bacterium]|nr:hypothetical protein [Thermomicrobiaceae bacterium]
MEMDDDLVILADLQPVRLPTAILEQIDRLADERRRLLMSIASSRDGRRVRARLAEIDRELSRLW